MKQITKNILSDYSKLDLENLLMNKDHKNQAILSDLDGTIHRGLYPRKLHGASYADLSIFLGFYLGLTQLEKHIRCNLKIYKDYNSLTEQKRPQTLIEKELILTYCNDLLLGLDSRTVEKAARWLPFIAYRKAKQSVKKMAKQSRMMIITKAIEPTMIGYVEWFYNRGSNIRFESNVLYTTDYIIEGLWKPGILCTSDKYYRAKKYLDGKKRAVIFGNTSEDLAMHNAAKDLGLESIMIAVHPRDKQVEEEADVIMRSWPELYDKILK